jgi:hypothetical protein
MFQVTMLVSWFVGGETVLENQVLPATWYCPKHNAQKATVQRHHSAIEGKAGAGHRYRTTPPLLRLVAPLAS